MAGIILVFKVQESFLKFCLPHHPIFRDETAAAALAGSFSRYHAMLRSQLAEPLRKFCPSDFAAQFISEAIITWTMAGKAFDEIYSMMEKLFS